MFKNKASIVNIVGIVFVLVLIGVGVYRFVAPVSTPGTHIKRTALLMDTVVTVDLYAESEEQGKQVIAEVFSLIEYWEGIVDFHDPDSLLYSLNNQNEELVVPEGLITMLQESYRFFEKSGGRFDPTVAPLLELWGFGSGEHKVPTEEEIERVQSKIDFEKVVINEQENTVKVPENMSLDLGAVAKGFVVDRSLEILKENNIYSALINFGGNIGVMGEMPDAPWSVGIRDPRQEGNAHFEEYILGLTSGGVATSGDYQRYFFEDGVRYSHIIDPLTGYPPRELRSSVIYAPTALEAELSSTTVFLLGRKEGQQLIEDLAGVEGLLIIDEELWHSEGFLDLLVE